MRVGPSHGWEWLAAGAAMRLAKTAAGHLGCMGGPYLGLEGAAAREAPAWLLQMEL
jgi:hypothetical protein